MRERTNSFQKPLFTRGCWGGGGGGVFRRGGALGGVKFGEGNLKAHVHVGIASLMKTLHRTKKIETGITVLNKKEENQKIQNK